MADTTAAPDTSPESASREDGDDTAAPVTTETTTTEEQPQKTPRGRAKAMPLLVHGTNATGIAYGAAYGVAGMPGLLAAGAGTVALGGAALASRKKRSRAAAARKSAMNRSSGGGRAGGGAGKGGLLGRGGGLGGRGRTAGGGRSGASPKTGTGPGHRLGGAGGRGTNNPGRNPGTNNHRAPGGKNGANTPRGAAGSHRGADGSKRKDKDRTSSDRPARTGAAWQTLKGWANKARRNTDQADKADKKEAGKTGEADASSTTRSGRMMQKLRGWANKLRPKTSADSTSGRLYRLRRVAWRKAGHGLRCAAGGLFAALGGLVTLPLGILAGSWRLLTRHRDPLGGFMIPVRIAGRIWRTFFRRSKARYDDDVRADQLNLKVDNPRKDDDVTGASLAEGTTVLNGHTSKFAMAMRAAHSAYTSYSPRSMMEVAAEYAGLPNGIRAAAMAVQQMAIHSDSKFPCSKQALAKLTESYERMMVASTRADEMVTLFRTAHRFDIERIVNPRTNEAMWNVTPTGPGAPEGAMFMPGRIESGCVVMAVLYRTYEPVHMLQVGSEYQGIGYGLAALAETIEALRERSRDLYPVDDRVTDEIGMLVATIRAAADDAGMAAKFFAADHHEEIRNNLNPRKGPAAESMWNAPR